MATLTSAIDSARQLASEIGLLGAALLILIVGIAWHLPKLAGIVREIIRDWQNHVRKTLDLKHRIERDTRAIGAKLDRLEQGTPVQNKDKARNERREK